MELNWTELKCLLGITQILFKDIFSHGTLPPKVPLNKATTIHHCKDWLMDYCEINNVQIQVFAHVKLLNS